MFALLVSTVALQKHFRNARGDAEVAVDLERRMRVKEIGAGTRDIYPKILRCDLNRFALAIANLYGDREEPRNGNRRQDAAAGIPASTGNARPSSTTSGADLSFPMLSAR